MTYYLTAGERDILAREYLRLRGMAQRVFREERAVRREERRREAEEREEERRRRRRARVYIIVDESESSESESSEISEDSRLLRRLRMERERLENRRVRFDAARLRREEEERWERAGYTAEPMELDERMERLKEAKSILEEELLRGGFL